MAEALELAVIVEGVETAGQASCFDAHDRPIFGQGWLFGKPGTDAALRDLLVADADADLPLAAECVA